MNYDEKYNNGFDWERQCNFPEDWNCDCCHNDENKQNDNKKYFYGYFIGSEYGNTLHTQYEEKSDCKKEYHKNNCDDRRNESKACGCQEETEGRPCKNRNTCRRCNCCFCNIFKRF